MYSGQTATSTLARHLSTKHKKVDPTTVRKESVADLLAVYQIRRLCVNVVSAPMRKDKKEELDILFTRWIMSSGRPVNLTRDPDLASFTMKLGCVYVNSHLTLLRNYTPPSYQHVRCIQNKLLHDDNSNLRNYIKRACSSGSISVDGVF